MPFIRDLIGVTVQAAAREKDKAAHDAKVCTSEGLYIFYIYQYIGA